MASLGIGPAELRAWLEAAAAAASINALIREAQGGSRAQDGAALLLELAAGVPDDSAGFLARARRAGFELTAGGAAIAVLRHQPRNRGRRGGRRGVRAGAGRCRRRARRATTACWPLLTGRRRLLALVPAAAGANAETLAAGLRATGLDVATSALRRDPAALTEALREVELLLELTDAGAPLGSHDETYRLLIGVLLRDPDELVQLRERTISPLADYDARHDTDLLATLRAFLAHDGSTTETADAMTPAPSHRRLPALARARGLRAVAV